MHIIMGTDHRRWAAIRGGWELSHLDESDLRCRGLEGSNLRKIDRRLFLAISGGEERSQLDGEQFRLSNRKRHQAITGGGE